MTGISPEVYAGPAARGKALVLDALILVFLLIAAALAVDLAIGRPLGGAGTFVVVAAYFVGFPLTKWQATPGKHASGLRITDRAGARLGAGRSLLRFAASILSIATFGLGYVVSVWNGRRQALHDLVAGTVVVDSNVSAQQIAESNPPVPPLRSRILNSTVFVFVLAFPALVYFYPMHGMLALEINVRNMGETLPVVAALDAYQQKNGRYPESLDALSPEYLPRQPRLEERTALYYAASPQGDQCWLAIVYWREAGFLPSDRVNEFECRSREWTKRDYNDMTAKFQPR